MKRGPVIAIDGPSGVGKTTVSRGVARKLGFRYINTGSMYRAIALAAKESWVDLKSDVVLEEFCAGVDFRYDVETGSVSVDGIDYTGRLRSQQAAELASKVSTKGSVREFLVAYQRKLAEAGNVVMEGRDIGTVVFPDADVKIFLDAPHDVRAGRRHLELVEKGVHESVEVSSEIEERDRRDSSRELSPLKMADDAIRIDTAAIGIDAVIDKVLKAVRERLSVGDHRS
ncbi:MAG TPA: (d)CMP kinase [Deltaproteobacteria bacterium]|nr:MAG: cytidylate kinase [Deltaproteobacteria bacterium GWA2_55_82]OGQ63034.1 MAG: cytidylate kinase [Deltaproteobacteria bacterium RIFCSPLOWO2_02_FULL_55_12]OIJ72999.1 MAG: cytidylate kinase [Deltaproteobacteria bacterium GWC2_55_46]HBG45990.1 (d)CMP kinase [Deltaproteobacteria bacterium]HCY11792.1 (d)CMP kinase [Deltaproteobacteria bacterium]